MRKKVLVMVRGAKPVRFKNNLLEGIRSFYFRKLTSDRGILDKDYIHLRKYLENDYDSVEIVHWNGEILNGDFSDAMLELSDILKKNKKNKIDVVGISAGGLISQRVLLYDKHIKINKLLLIGAIFREKKRLPNVKRIYNVYSEVDKMYSLVNGLLNDRKTPLLIGKNVKNISIKNIAHNDLCRNKKIKDSRRKEERLFEVYRNLLVFD
jgi:hypothetical protein